MRNSNNKSVLCEERQIYTELLSVANTLTFQQFKEGVAQLSDNHWAYRVARATSFSERAEAHLDTVLDFDMSGPR